LASAVKNRDVARLFTRYATLLEIEDANPFRVRAYRNAARIVEELPRNVGDMIRQGEDLSQLSGIGKDLAAKIREIVETGRLAKFEEASKRTPGELVDLTALPGLGAKRVRLLHDELRINTLGDLEKAARAGKVRQLAGFGPKTEERILKAIEQKLGTERRVKWSEAEEVARPLIRYLSAIDGVSQAVVAGSFRRCRETVGDLDILVTCAGPSKVMARFVSYEEVDEIISKGRTRATVRLRDGLQVDLRVVPEKSYGAALLYFTGSKAHNIALRKLAVKRGLKLNEYGVFKGREYVAGRTEKAVYRQVKLPYIEPELREHRGEIDAARKGRLPELIRQADLRGDLHCHTSSTDGRDTLKTMAKAARALGYRYLAISDHTRHLKVANGLDVNRLSRQLAAIDRLNDKLARFRLLKSAEVDILEDGSLDLPDEILGKLDLVVCAVHYGFGLSRKRQTERIIRAMDNRYMNILAHPSGRLLGRREAYPVDMQRLMEAALERGCFLEVNAQPDRLDLSDSDCKMAKGMGLKLAISTDAHSARQLDYVRFGVAQARRGWLSPEDVLNTRSWRALSKLLKRN
jgi:DNA polymerase (family 10)